MKRVIEIPTHDELVARKKEAAGKHTLRITEPDYYDDILEEIIDYLSCKDGHFYWFAFPGHDHDDDDDNGDIDETYVLSRSIDEAPIRQKMLQELSSKGYTIQLLFSDSTDNHIVPHAVFESWPKLHEATFDTIQSFGIELNI